MTGERIVLERRPRKGHEIEVRITALDRRGDGTAPFPCLLGPQREPRTYTAVVPRAVPGDRVRAVVTKGRGKRMVARLLEVLEPSPERVEPRCPHFGVPGEDGRGCGGCTLQALGYEAQLAAKVGLVRRLLEQGGHDPGVLRPAVGMDDPWHYRNKMEYSFGWDGQGRYALGLHPSGYRHDVLRLETCSLESPESAALLVAMREWAESHGIPPFKPARGEGFLRTLTIREGKHTGERMVELTTTHDPTAPMDGADVAAGDIARSWLEALLRFSEERGVAVTSAWWTRQRAVRGEPTTFLEQHLHGSRVLREELHLPGLRPLHFEIHPRAFFQPSTRQAEILYDHVVRAAGLDRAPQAQVLDLYCGTGTIGLCLAPFARHVTGVELQPDSVVNARDNATLNRIDNVTFHVGDVGEVLEEQGLARPGAADLVVVDPPRAGLRQDAREHLATLAAPRMVYVSCNPAALTEDLAALREAGWSVESIQPIDQFPQTAHIENVAVLERA
ncbi:MAG: 23S rRNA (uracil(1939)-C(5))-methyltransferase RlmD [Myxococcota bacterium]